jgi:hypothetical protein
MSIGNLKDYGNKGNNFPFQLGVLEGLQKIFDILFGTLNAQQKTPNYLYELGAGNTPLGAYSFSIANVGTATGIVDGQPFLAGATINYDGGALNNTLKPITYDASGTRYIITWIS